MADEDILNAFQKPIGDDDILQAFRETDPFDAQDLNRSPLQQPGQRQFGADIAFLGVPAESLVEFSTGKKTREQRAAELGILTEEGAIAGRDVASFAFDEKNRILAIQNALSSHSGKPVPVRFNEDLQELTYIHTDPESGERREATVNASGLESGDLKSLLGPLTVMTPEFLAAIKGGAVGGPPGTVLAGGAGAALGEVVRLGLGKYMFGINQEMSDRDIIEAGMGTGGIAVAAGGAGAFLAPLFTGALNTIKGRFIPKVVEGKFESALTDAAQAEVQETIQAVNRTLERKGFEPTLGQRADDPELLSAEAALETVPGASKEISRKKRANQAALSEYYERISEPFNPTEPLSGPFELGEEIQDVVTPQLRAEREKIKRLPRITEQEAIKLNNDLKTKSSKLIGPTIRGVALEEQKAFRDWAAGAYGKVGEYAKGLKSTLPTTRRLVKDLQKDEQSAIFKYFHRKESSVVSGFEDRVDEVSTGFELGDDLVLTEVQRRTPKEFEFLTINNDINKISHDIRLAQKGLTTDAPDIGTLKRLRGALIKDRYESAKGHPEVLEMLQRTDMEYAARKDLLDRSIVSKVLERIQGRNFKVTDEDVFKKIFQKDAITESRQFADLMSDHPEAMNTFRLGIWDEYKTRVLNKGDGIAKKQAHERFMNEFGDVVKPWFQKEDFAKMQRFGQFGRVVEKLNKRRDAALKKLEKSFPGRIESLDPSAILREVWRPENRKQLGQMKSILKDTPEVWKGLQFEAHRHMRNNIAPNGQLDFNKLRSYMGDFAYGNMIKDTFGNQYHSNLKTLMRALEIQQRQGVVHRELQGTVVKDLARAYVGLFTRPGRMITAADRIRQRASNKILLNSIFNPEDLKALVEANRVKPGTKKAIALTSQLGGTAFYMAD